MEAPIFRSGSEAFKPRERMPLNRNSGFSPRGGSVGIYAHEKKSPSERALALVPRLSRLVVHICNLSCLVADIGERHLCSLACRGLCFETDSRLWSITQLKDSEYVPLLAIFRIVKKIYGTRGWPISEVVLRRASSEGETAPHVKMRLDLIPPEWFRLPSRFASPNS